MKVLIQGRDSSLPLINTEREMMILYSASEIAKWFLAYNTSNRRTVCSDDDEFELYEGISHLKLQKLLFYAQGIYLAWNDGVPLFHENIHAWQHGPVVPEVYNEYKKYGKNFIPYEQNSEIEAIINKIEDDKKAYEALCATYDNFAIYTAWQLRNMTHENGTPWLETITKQGENAVINNELIKDYFLENIVE